MRRLPLMAGLALAGLIFGLGSARAQYPAPYYPAPGPVVPFAGSSYSFTPPGSSASSYCPPAYANYQRGYDPRYYGPQSADYYNYRRPAYDRSYYRDPGPYYYTSGYPYSSSYYSYYFTPGYFRY